MYTVEFTKEARKTLVSMPRNVRDLIVNKIDDLARDPQAAPHVKKLAGRPGFRMRVGDWRVIYTLDSGQLVVLVLQIGARGGIYQ